ncbi:PREDICTED: MADS-box protein AGL42 [Theobroma cacao]|uniref:MADS-box protein AGL42 n=1 Tax=Theobroma cacao TaxID=3641 RepID=A0AB32V8F4_THECC|nr:PREDICTED: MADS-box protein AGL42 [Theobroma cacao]XP_017974258.1 PREDICTED: MADS-box protein AGL42 [Theobroma cacao]
MGKRKMEMKVIENEKARKRVFEKRRNNLLKKAKELSILCDIKILVIIFELGIPKAQIWPDNDEEATQIINRFKQQPVKGDSKKAYYDSFASKKKNFGEKFPISEYKTMINHFSENQLQNLCYELDAKIAAMMNAINSKQDLTEGPMPKMLAAECQGKGFLNKGRGKEVDIYQEPIPIQQDQSFEMLYHKPNFMESPMMMQNDISYPQFDGSTSSSNIPYVPLPIHHVDPSWMQPAYMSYYDPTIHRIPPGIYYPVMPSFPSLTNESG